MKKFVFKILFSILMSAIVSAFAHKILFYGKAIIDVYYIILFIAIFGVMYVFSSLAVRVNFHLFLRDILKSRKLVFELAKKDIKNRYLGSYLGMVWAFVQPIITILIFWFVFQVGFKAAPVDNFPFILWLVCGIIPWTFFSEGLLSGTNSILDNSYLVKKVLFRVSILPMVRLYAALFIHAFFVGIIFILFAVYGYKPSIYNIQVIYYLLATCVLVLGLSWITSSLVIFIKDLGQIIGIIIQFGLWLTPILWSFAIIPPKYQLLFKINPMYYITEGYRDSFIYHIWFWDHAGLTLAFWGFTAIVFVLGALIFKKLRPHFADVL